MSAKVSFLPSHSGKDIQGLAAELRWSGAALSSIIQATKPVPDPAAAQPRPQPPGPKHESEHSPGRGAASPQGRVGGGAVSTAWLEDQLCSDLRNVAAHRER